MQRHCHKRENIGLPWIRTCGEMRDTTCQLRAVEAHACVLPAAGFHAAPHACRLCALQMPHTYVSATTQCCDARSPDLQMHAALGAGATGVQTPAKS